MVRELLTVPVGIADTGEVLTLGLRRDGPHGLIAGTTGSGKSELLQTILAGLALTHPPEKVSLLLLDYKGGAAFSDLARLPHTAGMLTDLEGHLAARALISLNSELRRRERILREADTASISEYEKLAPASGTPRARPLPNLVIVVDEFATLAEELPDFMDALIDVAQRGRSLGVHLLLATQSPGSGVVSPKIQANINFWICLRVALGAESSMVIGTDRAALIPVNTPGRGYLKVGGQVTGFQTARIAAPVEDPQARSSIRVTPFVDTRPVRAIANPAPSKEARLHPRVPTELGVACARMALEAAKLGIEKTPCPWLPPLPARLCRQEVIEPDNPDPSRLTVLLGLSDEPEHQRQTPLRLDLSSDGTWAVLGVLGSGKTTLLRQVALDVAQGHGAGDAHLYGLDAGDGSLNPLAALPHCGDVVGVDDLDRTIRLLGRLGRMAEERRSKLAGAGAGDWVRYRQAGGRSEGTQRAPGTAAWVVLLIDDYPAFAEVSDGYRHGVLSYQLASLIRGGPTVGIHTVVAASQRSDFMSTTFGLFGRRILLRQAERADYDLVQLPRDLQPVASPPGRAYINGAVARECQVIWPQGSDDSYPPPSQAVALVAATCGLPPEACPHPVPAFPSEVTLSTLVTLRPAAPDELVIGIGGPELEPLGVDLNRWGPHLLIAGRDRSGRSSALQTFLETISAAERQTRFLILAPRPSPLRKLAADPRVITLAGSAEEIAEALRWADEGKELRSVVLVADDCESLVPETVGPLETILRKARESGLRGLFAGRTEDLLRAYDNWLRYLRSLSCGILLAPEGHDGELFELRLPPPGGRPPIARTPGRGYLILGREALALQVALCSEASPPPIPP